MYLRLLDICNKNEPQQAWISIKTKGKQLVFVARQLQLKTQLNPTGRFSHVFSATQLHLALRSCSASCVACIMARCFQGLARHSGSISLRMFTSFTSSCFFYKFDQICVFAKSPFRGYQGGEWWRGLTKNRESASGFVLQLWLKDLEGKNQSASKKKWQTTIQTTTRSVLSSLAA